MCGYIGIVSKQINEKKAYEALNKLNHRGPDEEGEYINEGVYLGHKRLTVIDKENGKQPYIFNEYVLIYNGEIYNANELRKDLIKKGYSFSGYCDTEVLIKMFAEYKEKCIEKLNGIFSFAVWNNKTKEFFACRDRVGVKPLYYYKKDNEFMVASEIKSILSSYNINQIAISGLQEILGLGPSHSPGNGIYENVFELKAGHYFYYKNEKLEINRYWNVPVGYHTDTFDQTVKKVRELLEDSVRGQLVSDVPLCTLLSGGLDSTVITLIAKKYKPDLETYSIDYENNDKFFAKNDFQVARDNDFIKLVTERFNITHHNAVINNKQLVSCLDNALRLKDYPGMVDIDSSLFWFSKQIKKRFTVGLSGECSDEIFGGYPWFYREEFNNNFPWIRNLDERQNLLNNDYKKKLDLKNFVQNKFDETVSEAPLTGDETIEEKKHKQLVYLNMVWFMQTLLERKDRMTMGASLEVRVPFSDHRLIEYLYNIPWKYKFHNDMEKGLLRAAVEDIVPHEVVYRKKNPYPKTFNPEYLKSVKKLLTKRLKNKNSILYEVFDINVIKNLINSENTTLQKPWFGQLMTLPQLIAYLYQFDLWFETYGLNIVK
ncbi:MAG: asparagine synthase (glutamine-hydrolyzing) [Clostridia bacterium]|nr:asparagine synthase (glutamine-hydrolyzing) [Clostridia bacterium]